MASSIAAIPVAMVALSIGSGAASAATVPSAASASTVSWDKLTLINGGVPCYVVSDGVVYLTGSVDEAVAGSTEFAVLPPAARPRHSLYVKAYMWNGNVGTVRIQPDGEMFAFSPTVVWAQDITSLTSISFPVGE